MGGITGFITQIGKEENELSLKRMMKTLVHRGPDDRGYALFHNYRVGLGYTRLSVLDLSPYAHQPMYSHSKRYCIVFSGEVYNFRDLRQRILKHHTSEWLSHSDTEVLVNLIDWLGLDEALTQIHGMYAFALWDKLDNKLYIVRDCLGEKPLYYGYIGNDFVFGSELKSFRAFHRQSLPLSKKALYQYLQYSHVPSPLSIYEGVYKLLPGHYIEVPLSSERVDLKAKRYWSTPDANNMTVTFDDACMQLSKLFDDVISETMVSDVPVGSFLSGGIDSSLITSLMQSHSRKSVSTFSIGFNNAHDNEANYPKKVARHLKTTHHELHVTDKMLTDVVPLLPTVYDEPFADPSQLMTYIVSRFMRNNVTVALSADGADELFGGHHRYLWAKKIWRVIGFIPSPLRIFLSRIFKRIPEMKVRSLLTSLPKSFALATTYEKFVTLCALLDVPNKHQLYYRLLSTWPCPTSLLSTPFEAESRLPLNAKYSDYVSFMMLEDLNHYLPDDTMVKVDRAAMANSLEIRSPFLDKRIVEFSLTLPMNFKIHKSQSKRILRELLSQHVPMHLVDRPKKGFELPISDWLRGSLKEFANDLLSDYSLDTHGLFNKSVIKNLWQRYLSGSHHLAYQLWNILIFQQWYFSWQVGYKSPEVELVEATAL